MTRAERRRLERAKKKSKKTYTLTVEQIEQMKEDALSEATSIGFKMMLGFPLIVLRDKYGFGKKRMSDFIEYVMDQYKMFEEDYVSVQDIHKVLEKEVDVKILED